MTRASLKRVLLQTTPNRQIILFALPILLLAVLLILSCMFRANQQFSLLAKAFVHGQLNFLSPIGGAGQDPVFWHGKIYWSEGPFPALLLMPFVAVFAWFHVFFYQGYLQWFLVLGVLALVFGLARKLAYTPEDSAVLALGFTLGSVFIGVAALSASWYFAQVVTTCLLLWGLYEFCTARRWWLLGVICGLVTMTRATAAPIVLFFALELWRAAKGWPARFKLFAQLCLPLVAALALLAGYNFLRFHNPLRGGYADQLLYPTSLEAESYGVFSPIHIPTNLYSAFLRAPTPITYDTTSWTLKFPYIENNIYGMSMFVTSPYLLYLCTQRWAAFDKRARHLLVAASVSALLVFSYFGVGLVQFGYRYALDFLPGVFLTFMIVYKRRHARLSRGMRWLLLAAGFTNFYLLCPLLFS